MKTEFSVDQNTTSEEENLFRATTGLPFRCGMCGRKHRPGSKSVQDCVQKMVRISGFPSYWWEPYLNCPTVLVMTQHLSVQPENKWPMNKMFMAMHPTLHNEYFSVIEDLRYRSRYTHTERVSVMEALGAPDTLKYLDQRYFDFNAEAQRYIERTQEDQRSAMKDLNEKLVNWRAIPPDVFRVDADVDCDGTIRTMNLNGERFSASSVIMAFPTKHIENHWRYGFVLYDLFMWDQTPVISWGLQSRSVRFVTLWTGKNYLNLSDRVKLEGTDLSHMIQSSQLIELGI